MNFMNEALIEAKKAFDEEEIPVGAVIVKNNKIIARDHNRCESKSDSTLHAEMNVIKKVIKDFGEKVLDGCELYVTVEPCPMCAGAIINSRIKRVYIGCAQPKTGSLGSVCDLSTLFPHKPEIYFGFCEDECKDLMQKFFEIKRKNNEG